MAWTTPKTFTANSTLTAADLNTFLRDNMLETSAGKASIPGSFFTVTGLNAIAERTPGSDYTPTSEATASTTFVNLATVGPTVVVTTSTQALVFMNAQMFSSTPTAAWMTFAVSGATTIAASDLWGIELQGAAGQQVGGIILQTGLAAGVNTFTAKYRVSTSGSATLLNRRMAVLPL